MTESYLWDRGLTVRRVLVTKYSEDDDPISLADVKNDHLRVVNGLVEDNYIRGLIATSLSIAQRRTQRRILPETWRIEASGFPWAHIAIPYPPLIEVVSVGYYDGDQALQTMDADEYAVDAPTGPEAQRGSIRLVSGGTWPTAYARPDAVRVTFRSGYINNQVSPEVVDVPADITHARLLIIKDLYEHRGSQAEGSASRNVLTAYEILDSYRDRTMAG